MEASDEKKYERRFSDIHTSKPGWFFGRFGWLFRRKKGEKIVNLKPPIYKRYPFLAAAGALLILISIFTIKKLFTRAEVSDFYPSTCLGTWTNPQNAQGEPDNLQNASASDVFDDSNSAVYGGGQSRIFCGVFFPPDFAGRGELKNVGLTFVWRVGEEKQETSNMGQATSSEVSTSTPPEVVSTSTGTSTPPASTSTSALPKNSFSFFNVAFADDSSVSPPADTLPTGTSDTSNPAASENESDTVIVAPPINAELQPAETTTAPTEQETSAEQATSSQLPAVNPTPPAPDENFLKVSYSIGGQEWIEIANVNESNWQNFTVTIPVANWDDLKKIQIGIEGIPTAMSQIPKVYLDGMFLEVHYELPSVFGDLNIGGILGPSGTILVPGQIPVISLPPEQKPVPIQPDKNTFRADESPQFKFDLNSLPAPPAPEAMPSSTSELSSSTPAANGNE